MLPGASVVAQLHFSIAPDGTPYVVYRESASPFKVYVQKFDGTNWSIVSGAAVSAGDARQPSITFASDSTPYVAYVDATNNMAVTVRKFEGANWATVGTPGLGVRPGNTSFSVPSIVVSGTGVVYVSYMDSSTVTSFSYTRIARFDGTSWSSLGGQIGRLNTQANLALSRAGQLYVGYREANDYGGIPLLPTLMNIVKWNGSSWVTVGPMDFSSSATLPIVRFDPIRDVPYMLVTDENQKVSVRSPLAVLGLSTAVQMILSAGNVSISSPASVAFPGATASSTLQTLDVAAGSFSIEDLKGSGAGYYATISVSDLTSGARTIPKANISANVSGATVTRAAGSVNSAVIVPSTAGTI